MSADTLIKTYHALRPSDATKSDRSRYGRFLKEILKHRNASDDYLQNVVEHQIFLQNMTIRNRKDERRKEVGLPPLPPYQPRAKGRSSASKAKQRKKEEQQTENPKRTRNVNSGQFLEDFNSSFSLITGPDFNYHQQDPEEYRNVQAGRLFNSMRHFYRAKSTEKIKSDALVEVYSKGGPLQYLDPRTVDPITFANAFYHLTRRDMTSRDRGRLGFFRNECIRYKRDDKKYCNDANRHYTRLSKYFQDLQNKHKNSALPPRDASSMEDAESSRMEEEEEGKVEEGKGEESGNDSDGDRPDSPFDPYNFEQRPWYEGFYE